MKVNGIKYAKSAITMIDIGTPKSPIARRTCKCIYHSIVWALETSIHSYHLGTKLCHTTQMINKCLLR